MTNRERHESDEERDQSRRLDQQRAEEKHRRQAGKEDAKQGGEKWQEGGFGDDRQQHAEHTPRRQDGGWQESPDVERGAGRAPGTDRDHDPDSDGKR